MRVANAGILIVIDERSARSLMFFFFLFPVLAFVLVENCVPRKKNDAIITASAMGPLEHDEQLGNFNKKGELFCAVVAAVERST